MPNNIAGQTILEAYRDSQNAQYQQDELAQRKEEADNLVKYHKDYLDELHDYHQSDLARERALASLKLSDAYNEQFGTQDQTPTENLPQPNPQTSFIPGQNGGAPQFGISDPNASVQQPYQRTQGIPPEVLKLFPQGITVDPNYQSRQFAIQQKLADLAGYKAQKIAEGQAPSKEELQSQKDEAASARAHDTMQTRMLIASGQNSTRQLIAAMKAANSGTSTDDLQAMVDGGATGDLDLKPTNPKQIAALTALHNSGQVPFGTKAASALKSMNDLYGIFDEMDAMSKKLPTSGLAAGVQGLAVKSGYPSDLKTNADELAARAPQLVRNVMGIGTGRITTPEIQAAIKSMGTAGITQAQAQKKNLDVESDAYNHVWNSILGGQSFEQKVRNMEKYENLSAFEGRSVSYHGKVVPIIKHFPDGKVGLFDPNKGAYGIIKQGEVQ